MKVTLLKLAASTFYLGHSPKAPGTVGSIGALLAYLVLSQTITAFNNLSVSIVLAVLITILSILVSNEVLKLKVYPSKDPKQVVIDEWAGFAFAVIGHGGNVVHLLLGLALFRFFDIKKPGPVAWAEKFPRGYGITLDDVVAGIISAAIIFAVRYFGILN